MIIDNDLRDIVRLSKKRNGYSLMCKNLNGTPKCSISIKIRNFKKIGSLIEVDVPFVIPNDKMDKITTILQYTCRDIETKGFKEKMYVSSGHITVVVYKSFEDTDEKFVLGGIMDVFGGSV